MKSGGWRNRASNCLSLWGGGINSLGIILAVGLKGSGEPFTVAGEVRVVICWRISRQTGPHLAYSRIMYADSDPPYCVEGGFLPDVDLWNARCWWARTPGGSVGVAR